ncbi:MAG: hypothetical protein IJI37_00690 [Opitutales bacterium]|nr:hypothetical protein [Opitutales bacterium]
MTYGDALKSWGALCGFPKMQSGYPEQSLRDVFCEFVNTRVAEAWVASRWTFAISMLEIAIETDAIADITDYSAYTPLEAYDKDMRLDDTARRLRFLREETRLILPDAKAGQTVYIRVRGPKPSYSDTNLTATIPDAFGTFLVRGAHADWLRSQNRGDEADTAEGFARSALENEIYENERNQSYQPAVQFGRL